MEISKDMFGRLFDLMARGRLFFLLLALPFYFCIDENLMRSVYFAASFCLLLSLLDYLIFRKKRMLVIAVVIYVLHSLCCVA